MLCLQDFITLINDEEVLTKLPAKEIHIYQKYQKIGIIKPNIQTRKFEKHVVLYNLPKKLDERDTILECVSSQLARINGLAVKENILHINIEYSQTTPNSKIAFGDITTIINSATTVLFTSIAKGEDSPIANYVWPWGELDDHDLIDTLRRDYRTIVFNVSWDNNDIDIKCYDETLNDVFAASMRDKEIDINNIELWE